MARPDGGWIKLYRQLMNHELWLSEPFTRGQAWVDLLMLANHEEGFIRVRGHRIDIKRGQVGWSQKKLAERWKWSRKKVSNFLRELEEMEHQIEHQKNNLSTIITIVNYDIYQQKEQQTEPQKNRRRTAEEPQKNTNKKNKNDKNDKNEKKNIYADFVRLTEAEYQKLVDQYGEELTKQMIETLDNYKGATGRKYKSDYRAILNWVVERVMNQRGNRQTKIPKAFQSLNEWVGDDK